MKIMEIMELMNYNYESRGNSRLYEIYSKFISTNVDIFSLEQLEEAKINLLPPEAFDDGKKRSRQEYDQSQNQIQAIIEKNYQTGRGMTA